MIQIRRVAALWLGLWMGAAIFADVAVVQNFAAIDRFLAQPGSQDTKIRLTETTEKRARFILRRNASELNADIFEFWEWTQLVFAVGLFMMLLFGERPSKLMLAFSIVMLLILFAQRFYLTPLITNLGRAVADLDADNPLFIGFWRYHGIYSGLEIAKLVFGAALAIRLSIRTRPSKDHFANEYDLEMGTQDKTKRRRPDPPGKPGGASARG